VHKQLSNEAKADKRKDKNNESKSYNPKSIDECILRQKERESVSRGEGGQGNCQIKVTTADEYVLGPKDIQAEQRTLSPR
jgi:hypothetical protein